MAEKNLSGIRVPDIPAFNREVTNLFAEAKGGAKAEGRSSEAA